MLGMTISVRAVELSRPLITAMAIGVRISAPSPSPRASGVSPSTDDTAGDFGSPIDSYENMLVTGSQLWEDVAVEATLNSTDDDFMGLVVRYGGPDSYYSCGMTKDQIPDCNGGGASFVTGAFGLACAAAAVEQLLEAP